MDQEKLKAGTAGKGSTGKVPLRHHEHNYTNPAVEEASIAKADTTGDPTASDPGGDNHRVRSSGLRLGSSQHKADGGQRQGMQPSSTVSQERQPLEAKNKVMKKDVFNRIRRSEAELQKAAEMVRGGMTFQTASDTFNIPISTIRFYMARRGILPQRRRGRGSSGVRDDDLIHPPFEIIHYRLPDIDKPV